MSTIDSLLSTLNVKEVLYDMLKEVKLIRSSSPLCKCGRKNAGWRVDEEGVDWFW